MNILQIDNNDLQRVTSIFTLVALLIAFYQMKLNRDVKIFQVFERVYSENTKIYTDFNLALEHLHNLINENNTMKKTSEETRLITSPENDNSSQKKWNTKNGKLMELYTKKEHFRFLETGYHYEFVGVVVKRKILPFNLVFDLVPFPDAFWEESYDFIKQVRKEEMVDFYEDFQLLYFMYKIKRTVYSENNKLKNIIIAEIKLFILTNYICRLFLKSKLLNNWVLNDVDIKFR